MGCRWCHQYVVLPPLPALDFRTPLPHTEVPFGTVVRRSYVALSEGALLDGNHDIAPTGSPTTNGPSGVGAPPLVHPAGGGGGGRAPSGVRTHPSVDPSGSVMAAGTPL